MDTSPKPPKRTRGRPAIPVDQRLIVRSIRLSAEHWAKLDACGMAWLRQLIERGKPPNY